MSGPAERPLRTPPPADGRYARVPFQAYERMDAINASSLKAALHSPLHFKAAWDAPPGEETRAMRLGTMFHTLLLEPDRFDERYMPAPVNSRTNKEYGKQTKAYHEAQEHAESVGKQLASCDEVARMRLMRDAVMGNPMCRAAVERLTDAEITLVWRDDGLACKARVDGLCAADDGFALNVKTTERFSLGAIERQIYDLAYDLSEAWYRRGLRAVTGRSLPHYMLYVESKPPFDSALVRMGDRTLALGEVRVAAAVARIRKGFESGQWPGALDGVTEINAPEHRLSDVGDAVMYEPVTEDDIPF